MNEPTHDLRRCDATVSLAFTVLGKRWNGMILAVLGGGSMSFVELRRGVDGISDAVLSDRLAELTEAKLVVRSVEPGPPVSVGYDLTEAGRHLLPILDQLGEWAASNLAAPVR
ncbi:winged helix-turn-helix transcriptional regulator [Microbacterium sp. RD1]|uniref:winged helix-turn-helix transcriptional regulator n=1 Tax=Microbacterium sp. RD1 TaxID=3457313 RepID=UPI003FA54874